MVRIVIIVYIALLIFGGVVHLMQGINYKRAAAEPYGKLALLYFAESAADSLLAAVLLWLWNGDVISEWYVLYLALIIGGVIVLTVQVIRGRITKRPFFKI